jgi:PAS domain S-box-containing protein
MSNLAALQPILRTAIDPVVVMDPRGLILDWNGRAETAFGWSRAEVLGRGLVEVLAPVRHQASYRQILTRRLASAEPPAARQQSQLMALRRDGAEIPIEVSLAAFGESDSSVFLGFIRDISDRFAVHAQLAASESRFRAMADSAPAPVWMTSAEGGITFANEAFAEFAGVEAEALLGDAWIHMIHPDDIMGVGAKRAAARGAPEGPRAYGFEARFLCGDGAYRWMVANARPQIDDRGQFQGYIGMAMDMTETKAAEARQRLLINELNHRVKNTLASIQSIVRQTLRPDETPLQVRERLIERLLAMSAAHDVLTRESWEGAGLEEIVLQGVNPFIDDQDPGRITIAGPSLRVGASTALSLALAMHELSTNAVKYGALSTATGTVSIAWERGDDDQANLIWTERGGPPVATPSRKGFGTRLLDRGLAADLGGQPKLTFAVEGVRAVLPVRLA